MNIDQKLIELNAIYENYTNLNHLKPLIKKIELKTDHLLIEWLENKIDLIFVDLNGWFAKSDPIKKLFPTFEGLCMWRSEKFSYEWGIQLNKLLRGE